MAPASPAGANKIRCAIAGGLAFAAFVACSPDANRGDPDATGDTDRIVLPGCCRMEAPRSASVRRVPDAIDTGEWVLETESGRLDISHTILPRPPLPPDRFPTRTSIEASAEVEISEFTVAGRSEERFWRVSLPPETAEGVPEPPFSTVEIVGSCPNEAACTRLRKIVSSIRPLRG